MTAFPALVNPFGMRRILRVGVSVRMRGDLVLEREWRSRNVQHAWEFPWNVLIDADRATLNTFFLACRGRYLNDIAYVDPFDGVTYTCRLDQDQLLLSEVPLSHWSGSVRLVEISSFKALKAAVATFPATVPFQALTHGRQYGTVIEPQEDGSELRYEDFGAALGIQRWGVGGDALTDDQAEDLLDCWEGNGGPYYEFEFTDPVTSTVYDHCHFVETECVDTLVLSNGDTMVHSIHLTVEELPQAA